MAKYLVTGGAGFIGSHIVELALQLGHEVIVVDDLSTGKLNNLIMAQAHSNFTLIEQDICQLQGDEDWFNGVDHIIHCAAKISVAESVEQPELYHRVNVEATEKLLEAAVKHHVTSFVLSSSAAVYGDNPALPKHEDMLAEPKSPYAQNKLDDEALLEKYHKQYGLNTVALRYFNVFGPKQDPHSPYAAAMPHFISQAQQHKDITIFGDGEQTRDFIFVEDIAIANLLAARSGQGIYNIANGHSITITELANKIKDYLNSTSTIIYGEERAGDIKHSKADCTRFNKQWPHKENSLFDDALAKTINYYIKG